MTDIILMDKLKGYERVKELVEGETNDYGHFNINKIEMYDNNEAEEYYRVEIESGYEKKLKILHFRYDIEDDKILIELGEDSYEYVEDYNYTIKYFWMALLEW